jgi:ribosomal protein L12E/L44/L45/RPP1/RPP2
MNSRIGRNIVGTLVVAALTVTACGGGSSGDRAEAVDLFVEAMDDEGVEVDRECAENVADKLSDDDVKAIIDESDGGDATLSPAGEALSDELLDCVDTSSLISDEFIDQIVEGAGDGVDADCIRDALEDLDLSNPEDPAVVTAMLACVEPSG